eukprot:scaffold21221_cov60-Phaeocystis_antarctica.AAC.11
MRGALTHAAVCYACDLSAGGARVARSGLARPNSAWTIVHRSLQRSQDGSCHAPSIAFPRQRLLANFSPFDILPAQVEAQKRFIKFSKALGEP